MPSLPPEMILVLASFAQLFSERVWWHAQVLVWGAILAPGKRTVSSCLQVMGLARERHFTNYHRVLNRAQWSALQARKILLGVLVAVLVPPYAAGAYTDTTFSAASAVAYRNLSLRIMITATN
jgi:hypothetical protein